MYTYIGISMYTYTYALYKIMKKFTWKLFNILANCNSFYSRIQYYGILNNFFKSVKQPIWSIILSSLQLSYFRTLMETEENASIQLPLFTNHRPVQPLNNRTIYCRNIPESLLNPNANVPACPINELKTGTGQNLKCSIDLQFMLLVILILTYATTAA